MNHCHQAPAGIGALGCSTLCISTMYVPSSSFLDVCSITAYVCQGTGSPSGTGICLEPEASTLV